MEPGQELVNAWVEVQRRWWAQLVQPYSSLCCTAAFQDSARRVLKAQVALVGLWAQSLRPPAGHGDDAVERWLDGHRELWRSWFDAAEGDGASGAVRALEQAAERLIEAQAAWAESWIAASAAAASND